MIYQVSAKYVCGIDLHAKNLTACVMDKKGKIQKKKTMVCSKKMVLDFLSPREKDITVGVESTCNWYWLIDLLTENNIPCRLGHALYIKRKISSKHKTDTADARGIADLLRTNQFPVAYAYPKEMRTVRDLLRRRHFFVRKRAATFTHVQNSLHQDGCIEPLRNKLQYKSARWSLVDKTENIDLQNILTADLEYIAALDTLIENLDKKVIEKARLHNNKHYEALQTMPGCGKTTALTIIYETQTIQRFRTPRRYSSYSRVVRAENESAGKNLGGTTNDKIGNPCLKWAFAEIGYSMIRNYPVICEWHQKQAAIHGKSGAHARLRHKIAVTVYHMMKNDTVFDLVKFLGKNNDRVENHSQQWSETSGHQSEPVFENENSSGLSQSKRIKYKRNNSVKRKPGRLSLRTTGKRKVLTKS